MANTIHVLIETSDEDALWLGRLLIEPQIPGFTSEARRIDAGFDTTAQRLDADVIIVAESAADGPVTIGKRHPLPILAIIDQDSAQARADAAAAGAWDCLIRARVDSDSLVRAIRYCALRNQTERSLRECDERTKTFVQQRDEAICRFSIEPPLSVKWDPEEQLQHLLTYGTLTECNDFKTRMHGLSSADRLIGSLLRDMAPYEHGPNSLDLRRFIRESYRLADMESIDFDRAGEQRSYLTDCVGIVDDDWLTSVWITQRDITERKNEQLALERSEGLYRTLTSNFPNGSVILTDTNLKVIVADGLGLANIGLTSSDFVGSTAAQIAEFTDRPEAYLASYQEALAGRQGALDYKIGTRWRKMQIVPVFGDNGAVSHVLSMSQDVTEQKLAEDELRYQRDFTEAMLHIVPSLVVVVDITGSIVRFNRSSELATGYTWEEAVGQNVLNLLVAPEELEAASQTFAQMASGVPVPPIEYHCVTKDGRRILLEWAISTLLDESGDVKFVLGAAKDVTASKHAEEALRESEMRLRQMADGIREVFWMTTPDFSEMIYVSPAFEGIWMRPCSELYLNPMLWVTTIIPEHQGYVLEAIAGMATTDSFKTEYQVERPDGSRCWIEDRGYPVYDEHGVCKAVAGVATDITDRKLAEIELAKSQVKLRAVNEWLEEKVAMRTNALADAQALAEKERAAADESRIEAERANRAKSEFLSRMSHELRTPMNSILGFTQIMEMHAEDAKQIERIGHVMKAGQHLLKLINEVLELSRIESGRLGLSIESVPIADVIMSAIDIIQPLYNQRQLSLAVELGEHNALCVRADQQKLSQVVLNLLSNAKKYNRPGGGAVVSIEKPSANRLRVAVTDTGIGINPQYLPRVFQPFERLGADERGVPGTGLGLSVSKQLIEAMGGAIGFESVEGVGSKFWIDIDIADSSDRPLRALGEVPAAANGLERMTVLYIEDNSMNQRVVADVLDDQNNVHLMTAMQGQLGLDIARQHRPDVILLDIHLPDIPGDEVLRQLRSEPLTKDIPVIVISADATAHQIGRLMGLGADDYLTKPLDVRHFLDVTRKYLLAKEPQNVG